MTGVRWRRVVWPISSFFRQCRRTHARLVYAGGRLVAEDGHIVADVSLASPPCRQPWVKPCGWIRERVDSHIPALGQQMRVIGSLENQLVTEERILPACIVDGHTSGRPDPRPAENGSH